MVLTQRIDSRGHVISTAAKWRDLLFPRRVALAWVSLNHLSFLHKNHCQAVGTAELPRTLSSDSAISICR